MFKKKGGGDGERDKIYERLSVNNSIKKGRWNATLYSNNQLI
jgi:hypothetical protein